LILPHVTDPDRRQTLLGQFPSTRPTVESDSDVDTQMTETTTPTPTPAIATQPLRVLVSRSGRTVEGGSPPTTKTPSNRPTHQKKKRKSTRDLTDENTNPDQSLLTDVKRLQRRMVRLCKEQKRATADLAKLQAKLEARLK